MTKIKTTLLLLLSLALFSSCTFESEDTATYFGGKIINPKSKKVVLYYLEKAIDTLLLNEENKFLSKYDSLNEGLYHFKHGNEYQYIYLQPKDSLMLRLNTWDFDESLVYAGKGAERNNILIDCFLEEEKEKKMFYAFNRLQPKEFKTKVDSILKIKLQTLNNFIANHPKETEGFKEVLKATLTYPIYTKIERYPKKYAYFSKTNSYPEVDADFYNYRKEINVDNIASMYYSPYSKYLINYLYNKTYSLGYSSNMSDYSEEFTLDLLGVIDTELKSEKIKNTLLKQTVIGHFNRKSSSIINIKSFDKFLKLSTNDDDKTLIKKLIHDVNALPKGEKFKDFSVLNYNHTKQSIKDIIKNKNVFLFFWNTDFYDETYIVSRIDYLTKKYPKIDFLLIKTEGNTTKRIQTLDIKNQFYLETGSKAHQFLTSKRPRSIIINNHGIIVNGYASITSSNINHYLNALNKK